MTTHDNAIDDGGLRITHIRAKNYRSIRELDLELGPLTILVGPNASGKSNVLDVLRFIRDAVSRGLDFAISKRHGIKSLRHQYQNGRGRRRDVELGFRARIEDITLDYNFILSSNLDGGHSVKREYGWYRLDSESEQLNFDTKDEHVIEPRPLADSESIDFPTDDLSFFRYRRALLAGMSNDSEDHGRSVFVRLYLLQRDLSELCFYHVFPNTIREPQKQVNSRRLDEQGTNLASVLREMQRSNIGTGDFGHLSSSLAYVVPGITEVRTEAAGGYLVLQFKHSDIVDGKGVWLDAAQESDGTLRMLALLTAIYQRRQPSFLGIEEPESAVHPGALAFLADVFQEASLRTQIVITTHSPDLIDHLPIDSIRAVEFVDGETKVGEVSNRQASAVRERLFTLGELHSMEGLEIHTPVAH